MKEVEKIKIEEALRLFKRRSDDNYAKMIKSLERMGEAHKKMRW